MFCKNRSNHSYSKRMNRSCIKALHLWASGASERKNVLRSSDRSFVAQARMSHDTLKVVAGGVLLSRQEVHLVNLSGHRPIDILRRMTIGGQTANSRLTRNDPRYCGDHRNLQGFGYGLRTPTAKGEPLLSAFWTIHVRHIFDHSDQAAIHATGHLRATFGDASSVAIGCGDKYRCRFREIFMNVHGNVTCPGRKIQHHVLGLVPESLLHHLTEGFPKGASPHNRCVVTDKELH